MADRDLDLVVLGATGVTGRRVAAYLEARARETGARWAVAGRSAARLRSVLDADGVSAPETLVADAGDIASLRRLVARARVVLNLVGPYTRHGMPVVEACVAGGAHYVDLTGEIPFVRRVVDTQHERATAAGVKVVQVCGFEALPPDMAVALAVETARRRWHEDLAHVDVEVSWRLPPGAPRPSDAISGGTLQSLVAVAEGPDDPSVAADPAALVTDPHLADVVREVSPIRVAPRRDRGGRVLAPMAPAAFINPAVVHRSAALRAGETAGGAFSYREGVVLAGPAPTLPVRLAAAGGLSAVQAAALATVRARPRVRRRLARVLGRVLPGSGFGPDADRLEGWHWDLWLEARTTGGAAVRVHVDADGHPGYLATARMVGEAGLMLAEPETTPRRSGCLTPSTALGTTHVDRFRHARVRFHVLD